MSKNKCNSNKSDEGSSGFKIRKESVCINCKEKKKNVYDNFNTSNKVSQHTACDFETPTILYEGAFGSIALTTHKETGIIYAAKVFAKNRIIKNSLMKRINNEKQILESIDFPFVVRLEYSYQDQRFIYLVMPFVCGFNLDMYTKQYGKMDEDKARFYLSETLLAVEFLHELDLSHRDIKPHNILIDIQGHVKLTDFGLCKHIIGHAYSFCGTFEYMAPEILHRRGYGKSVDIWSMGVMLYELVAGYSPFWNTSPSRMFKNISNAQYNCPLGFSGDLINLLRNMLRVDVTRRYGNLVNGFLDIRTHKWFHATDWYALFNKAVTPPFVPTLSDAQDTKNLEHQRDGRTNPYDEEFNDF